jgi:NAD(P)-dependent dehydrogenase (short-subunit alcohol dehydrogenase family)
MTTSFTDRVAVVTGAGRGIGRATALALAARGAAVVVNDLDEAVAVEVVEEISRAGGKAAAVGASVADWASAEQIIGAAIDRFGRIDALINNAGYLTLKPIWDMDEASFEAEVRVHLFGTFFCTRHAVPHMMAQGYGRIVNVVSRAGLVGAANSSAYAAGKGGIFGFTNSIARDLVGTGVNVNAFNPAATATRLVFDNQTPEGAARMRNLTQDPAHVAAVAAYLASEACDFSGQSFFVGPGAVGPFPPITPDRTAYKTGTWTPEELAEIMPRFEFPALVKSLYLANKENKS